MGNMKKIVLVLICLALATPSIWAASCIAMSNGGTNNINVQNGVPSYVSLRIYNSTIDKGICEDGTYTLKAELVNDDLTDPFGKNSILTFFDYSFSDNNFQLTNGENKQSLLTLTPKKSGVFIIKITATKNPTIVLGSSIVSTTSALIKVEAQGADAVVQPVAQEVPFWTTHKNCSDGSVVLKSQKCPGDVNKVIVAQQTNNQAAEQKVVQTNPVIDTSNIPLGAIAGILIIGGACVFLFKPKKEKLVQKEVIIQDYPSGIIPQTAPAPIVQEAVIPKTIIQSKLMIHSKKPVRRIAKRKVIIEKKKVIPQINVLPKSIAPKNLREMRKNFHVESKKAETIPEPKLEIEKIEVVKEPQSFPNPLVHLMDSAEDRQIKKQEAPKEDGNA